LETLGNDLTHVQQTAEALAATTEAVEIFRSLGADISDEGRMSLALALKDLANHHLERGEFSSAAEAADEAAALFRALSPDHTEWARCHLMMTLFTGYLSRWHLQCYEEALVLLEEKTNLVRSFLQNTSSDPPGVLLAGLAEQRHHAASLLDELGRADEALIAVQESVELYRSLWTENSDQFAPNLVECLAFYTHELVDQQRFTDALPLLEETARLCRPLVDREPSKFGYFLGDALSKQSKCQTALGRPTEGRASATEALGLLRPLCEAGPSEYQWNLAAVLEALATAELKLDRPRDAEPHLRESATLLREVARDHSPSAFNDLRQVAAAWRESLTHTTPDPDATALLTDIEQALADHDATSRSPTEVRSSSADG
jgi:tetratricopeptide (TPR) repeat protein